jgi:hypothetical protein
LAASFIAFIVMRNRWRDEISSAAVARYNWQTGKWEWGDRLRLPLPAPAEQT